MDFEDRNSFITSVSFLFFSKHLFKQTRQHRNSFLKDCFHSWRSFKKSARNWQYGPYYFCQYDSIHFNYTVLQLKWQITPSGNHRIHWKMFQFLSYMELFSHLCFYLRLNDWYFWITSAFTSVSERFGT